MQDTWAVAPSRQSAVSSRRSRGIAGRTSLAQRSYHSSTSLQCFHSNSKRSLPFLLKWCRGGLSCLSSIARCAVIVLIVALHPISKVVIGTRLVAALRRQVEKHVGAQPTLVSARISGIGMKHDAALILEEHAHPGGFAFGLRLPQFEVVIGGALRQVVLREGHLVVAIEIAAERRDPFETPAHAFLIGFDLRQRCT